jgi:hypothetical protein
VPIFYDPKKEGFVLKDPTEEETEALERLAVNYITMSLGKMAADAFLAQLAENTTTALNPKEISTTKTVKH